GHSRPLRRSFGGRDAAQGAGVLARARPHSPDARQLRSAPVRRRHVGTERPARPFRFRGQDARTWRRGRGDARRAGAETLANPVARAWLLDRQIVANEVGLGLVADTRAFLESLDTRRLADFMIGGLSVVDLPDDYASEYLTMVREACGVTQYLMPPLPNTLYTRDTTCWIYGGGTVNPLYHPPPPAWTALATPASRIHP